MQEISTKVKKVKKMRIPKQESIETMDKLTYSATNMFANCPRQYKHRYIDNLVAKREADELRIGNIIHKCLEIWYKGIMEHQNYPQFTDEVEESIITNQSLNAIATHLNNKFPNRESNIDEMFDFIKCQAMIDGYLSIYADDIKNFKIIAVEEVFENWLFNPNGHSVSKTFRFSGKIDLIVQMINTGEVYIVDHKTTSSIDDEYIEKLKIDTQTSLYSIYIEKKLGIKIAGALYNVIEKSKHEIHVGETEDEYLERLKGIEKEKRQEYAAKAAIELDAKKKLKYLRDAEGWTSSARRDMPETIEEFNQRIQMIYNSPDSEKYHREYLYFSKELLESKIENLWYQSKNILFTKAQKFFPQNTSFCFNWHRPCDYFEICTSCGNPDVIKDMYVIKRPHSELRDEEDETEVKNKLIVSDVIISDISESPIIPNNMDDIMNNI